MNEDEKPKEIWCFSCDVVKKKWDFSCCEGKARPDWCFTCITESKNPEYKNDWCFSCPELTKIKKDA